MYDGFGDDMKDFMKHDFTVQKIELACLVAAGKASMVHKNRKAHGVAIFLGGERVLCFDDKKIKATKNTVVYFPKGSNYSIKEKVPSDCYAINFQMPDGVSFPPFALQAKNAGGFLESFKSAVKIWTKKSAGYPAKVKSELYDVLYRMQSEYEIPYGKSSVIQPAIDYIHSNYHKEPIRVEHLASLCKISTVHLSNSFVKAFAMPPIRYVNSLKMIRAKELLESEMVSIRQVCFLSGYNDESYFSREFKKHYGISPTEYVKLYRI